MPVVSNGQFWIYTNALLIFWIIVFATALNNEYRIKQKIHLPQADAEDEMKYTGICKNLCHLCDCLGFYCGEECICECNDEHRDTECLRKIQISAQSLNIPFEVLIQGPTANKFVRNALLYEQNQERKLNECHNKRSTVTIYKPSKANLNMQKYSCEKKTAFKDIFKATDISKKRQKRSSGSNKFEWFSSLGTSLLRPAPLGGRKRQVETTKKPTTKATTVSSVASKSRLFDTFDDTRIILTPRPLKKRKNPKTDNENVTKSSPANNALKDDDVPEAQKKDFNYSEKLKDTKRNKKKSFLPDETDLEKPQGNLIGSLYSRLFKNSFDKKYDKLLLEPAEENPEKPQESHSYQDELGEIETDQSDLFDEEEEEEEARTKKNVQENKTTNLSKSQNILSTSQKLSPTKMKKSFSAPWLETEKLIQKLRQAIYA